MYDMRVCACVTVCTGPWLTLLFQVSMTTYSMIITTRWVMITISWDGRVIPMSRSRGTRDDLFPTSYFGPCIWSFTFEILRLVPLWYYLYFGACVPKLWFTITTLELIVVSIYENATRLGSDAFMKICFAKRFQTILKWWIIRKTFSTNLS